jgi:Amt family ammonium transporter
MALSYTTSKHGLIATGTATGAVHGNWTLLKWQFFAAAWVIVYSAIGTFILLKLVGLVIPLRMKEEDMEIGDIAEHGHEVYPSDVPSLGFPGGVPGLATGAGEAAPSPA